MSKSLVLRVENLTFAYMGKEPLYRDFNLTLNMGECVSIIGASGSGKSTLFELIAGNLKPKKGKIYKEKLAWVFQDPYSSFAPTYPILEQLKDVASLDKLDEYLPFLNLDRSLLYKLPHKLSGGQLQRCSILRAILMEPKLLLCDEPTSALDNITQLETMKLLISLLDRVGILLITHDRDLATWASDRIINIAENQKGTE